jgi:hypothetical protein
MAKSKKVENYFSLIDNISSLLESARRTSARAVNTILTATYWEIGRRIVEFEISGIDRSEYYGKRLIQNLSSDLTQKFGRGFGKSNVFQMKAFYLAYQNIFHTASGKSSKSGKNIFRTSSGISYLNLIAETFPLPWSHYVRLLSFFHRRLKCLVIIDLKVGKFTHSDAGQMHMYLNYAKEHWTNTDENPPVGLILCAEKDSAVAKYALDGLPNKILASEYKLNLPDEKLLAQEIFKTKTVLEKKNNKRK